MQTLFAPAVRVVRENRGWLVIAAAIFILSAVFFYRSVSVGGEPMGQLTEAQLEQLWELVRVIMEASPLFAVMLVFVNNLITVAQMLLLGVLAGISPLLTISLNGAVVGITLSLAAGEGVPLLPLLVLGILPHGIFELFAFFLCGALGLKFGYHCVASPLPGKNRLQSFRYIWKEALSVLPLVVVLLLVAALVEILVTPHLLGLIMEANF